MSSIKNRIDALEESFAPKTANPVQSLAEHLREARLKGEREERERKLKGLPEPPRETEEEIRTHSRMLRERLNESRR